MSARKQSLFLEHLESWTEDYLPNVKGYSNKTIKSYKTSWRLFMLYMREQHDITPDKITYASLSLDALAGYGKWLESARKCSARSRNVRMAAISSFSAYAQNKDFEAAACFRSAMIKVPNKRATQSEDRSHFEKEEIKHLLAAPTPRDKFGYRDSIILQFMYASGARSEEVCLLKAGDIRFPADGKASVLIHGKNKKTRRIKISKECTAALEKYMERMGILGKTDSFVFSTQRNEQMSVDCIQDIFNKYVTRVRKEHPDLFPYSSYSPHSMRHTTAIHMLESGVPLLVIKQFLGHSSISTTEIYARISQGTLNEELKKWDYEYWHEMYLDEPSDYDMFDSDSADIIPGFLK